MTYISTVTSLFLHALMTHALQLSLVCFYRQSFVIILEPSVSLHESYESTSTEHLCIYLCSLPKCVRQPGTGSLSQATLAAE